MKFKIGDVVRVINKDLQAYNAVGTVIDIDPDWSYPYEINFGGQVFTEELFAETDLALVKKAEEVPPKNAKDFINIEFQKGDASVVGVNGATIQDVVDLLIERMVEERKNIKNDRYFEYTMVVAKLKEVKMWLDELALGKEG